MTTNILQILAQRKAAREPFKDQIWHMHEGDLVDQNHEDVWLDPSADDPASIHVTREHNTGAQVDEALEKALPELREFLINERCSCIGTADHPCPRCLITINDVRELLTSLGIQNDD